MFGSKFVPQILWHRGERLSPQQIYEIFIRQKFVKCVDDKDQLLIAKPGFAYQQFLFLAFAPVSTVRMDT